MVLYIIHPEWLSYTSLLIISRILQITSSDSIFLPRHTQLRCGIPMERPALGINRLCGSGFQAVVNGAQVRSMLKLRFVAVKGVDNVLTTKLFPPKQYVMSTMLEHIVNNILQFKYFKLNSKGKVNKRMEVNKTQITETVKCCYDSCQLFKDVYIASCVGSTLWRLLL